VVQVAAVRKVQPLAATWELPHAGAEMGASACAPARRPTAAEALISWAAGSAWKPWQNLNFNSIAVDTAAIKSLCIELREHIRAYSKLMGEYLSGPKSDGAPG